MELAGSHNRVAMRDFYEIHHHGEIVHTLSTEQLFELRSIAIADWRHAEFRRFFNVGMFSLVASMAGLIGYFFWLYLQWGEAPGQNFISFLAINNPLVTHNWIFWCALVVIYLTTLWQARYARAAQTLKHQSDARLQCIDAELMRRRCL